VRAVFFDVGETLVDETAYWGRIADLVGVPRLTFFGVLGGLIERGEHHREVFPALGVRWPEEGASYAVADFYPDALPCLAALGPRYVLGIVGNQSRGTERFLVEQQLGVDVVASSAGWGVEKPAPEFFARIVDAAGVPAHEIAYVGDRIDNDVLPAREAGMVAVHVRRGPWGYLQARRPEGAEADIRIGSLAELPAALADV
jgi:FMN phosphatase YigB (HAD superfamily)